MTSPVEFHTIFPGEDIPQAYFRTRFEILRQPIGMPEGSERLEDDKDAIHCFATVNDRIVAVGRLHLIPESSDGEAKDHDGPGATTIPAFGPLSSNDSSCRPAVQIRQMGTVADQRRKGFAKELLRLLEEAGMSHFQAAAGFLQSREIAIDFYQHSGWEMIDEPYSIGKIGLHRSMMKRF